MQRLKVVSSNVVSIGYDEKSKILEIEFNDNSVYKYLNVPNAIYKALMTSNSKGKFIHLNIKGKFSFQKA